MESHGLPVGPNLFTLSGNIAYAVIWSQFGAAFCILVIGVVLAYAACRVSTIDLRVLAPIIAVFCLIGGFAKQQYVFDMGIMLFFGVVGYFMRRNNYSPIALVLGLVLGKSFDANLIQGLKMGFGSPVLFFNRPFAILLWLVFFGSLFGPMIFRSVMRRYKLKTNAINTILFPNFRIYQF